MFDLVAGVGVATDELVAIEGSDAVEFLDGQVTQDIRGMAVGDVRRSMLLEPRGKLRAILWVLRDEERVLLVTPRGTGGGVIADLDRFRFRVAVNLRLDDRPVHSVWAPAEEPGHGWSEAGSAVEAFTPAGVPHHFVAGVVPPEGRVLDADALAAHRIAAGEPRFGEDVDDATIPQETGLVPEAVSFTKGCFVGQELVARIDSRGHVNRLLRRVVIDGVRPPRLAEVVVGGKVVGTLGTVAPRGAGGIALALVRREAKPGQSGLVRWAGGEAPATIQEIARVGLTGTSHTSNSPLR
ncbi:MAG: hypothetical protein AAB198_02350 [Actinomycetota bacterium]